MPDHPVNPEIDLVLGDFYASDPQEQYAWMRANAPVYFDEPNGVWGIARYDHLKAVARDPKTFSNAGGIRPGVDAMPMMIDMDDPAHLRRRKLVNKGFTPKQVRELEPKIHQVCDEIVDAVIEQGECDLVADIAAKLPMIMIGDALGVAPEDRWDLLRWSDDMVSGLSNAATEEQLLAAGDAFANYSAYAAEVIADRRKHGPDGNDLMSILVHAEVDGDRLDDDELMQESLLILVGGDETTRHVISGGMEQLIRNPDQRADLTAAYESGDDALIDSAVEEMLRWVTPIKNMARMATRDVTFEGQDISEGQKLLLLYPSANRDEAVFTDPQRFDIRRTPNDHVAFGFGTHFCLGASLARLEVRVMIEKILLRMRDMEITGATPLRAANFVSGFEEMPVKFVSASPTGA